MILGEKILEEVGTGQAHQAAAWLPSGQRLLEIGCSAGYLTRFFKDKTDRIVGFDINFPALQSAKERNREHSVICGSVEKLPFLDDSFDAIVMLEVIEHIDSDVAAVNEVRRVLKPGGTLILSTPNVGMFAFLDPYNVRKAVQRKFSSFYNLAARLVRFESGQFTDNMERHRHYRLKELAHLLKKDFTIRAVHRGGLLLYPLTAASISVAGRVWNNQRVLKWLFRLLNWDFQRRFGSLAYNLMILAERKR
jgi:2-polyprenyl-3-methyl-5-hydroxy-6-metoxy-1,4-benzoquinol methylase